MEAALSSMGLYPYIEKTKGSVKINLTHNTFAGKFNVKKSNAAKFRNVIRYKIANSIRNIGLNGTVLVVVGVGWAWGKRLFSTSFMLLPNAIH
jgi:hypothetical protein